MDTPSQGSNSSEAGQASSQADSVPGGALKGEAARKYQEPPSSKASRRGRFKSSALPKFGVRDPHIDIMKGIGILCVIVMHMQTANLLGYSIIADMAMFAMPMFFFISGYLFKQTTDSRIGFRQYLVKKFKTLWIPYTVFFIVLFLWMELVLAPLYGGPVFGFTFEVWQLAAAYVFAGQFLYDFSYVMFPIWFLHALFLTSLVFFFIMKIRNIGVLACLAIALSIAALPLQMAMEGSPFWIVKLFPAALCYMVLGHLLWRFVAQKSDPENAGNLPKSPLKNAASILGSLVCFLVGFNFMMFGGGSIWDISAYWHYLGAVISILGCYLFAQGTNNALLQYVGIRSLLFLGLHTIILSLPFVQDMTAILATYGYEGFAAFLIYFIVSFLLITILVEIAFQIKRLFNLLVLLVRILWKKPTFNSG